MSRPLVQYVLSLGAVSAALLVRWLLDPYLGDQIPFLTIFAVLMPLALLVRPGPFLAGALLGLLGASYLFFPPKLTFKLATEGAELQFVLFALAVTMAALTAWLAHRAHERQRSADALLRAFVDDSPTCKWVTDPEGRIIYVNRSMAAMFGKPVDQLLGRTHSQILPPQLAAQAAEHIQQVRTTGQPCTSFEEIDPPGGNGQRRVLEWRRFLLKGSGRGQILIAGMANDVTEKVQAESALRQSQARLRSILEQLPVAVGVMDCTGQWMLSNSLMDLYVPAAIPAVPPDRAGRWRGWDAHGNPASPEDWPGKRALRGERVVPGVEMLYTADDGREIWMRISTAPLHDDAGQIIGATCVVQDIDLEKRAEQALRAKEEELETVINRSPFLLTRCSRDLHYLFVSSAYAAMLGRKPEEIAGKPIAEVMGADGLATIMPHVRRVLDGHIERYEAAVPFQGIGPRELSVVYMPDTDATGEIVGWVASILDITDRKRAEDAMRESEQRFRTMADITPVMIWVTNAHGEIEFVNQAYASFFGITEERLRLPGGWPPLVHPDDHGSYVQQFLAAVSGRAPFRGECRVRRADGQWRWIATFASPRFSVSGEFLGHVGSSPDITEHKLAEQALRDADRRKNEFLATLSHELRNPLAPIRNALQILKSASSWDDQANWSRDVIDRQVRIMARLMDDLLDVSRITQGKLELRREPVELGAVIRSAVETSAPLIQSAGLRLHLELDAACVWVDADPIRLAQVLGNLLTNSAKYTDPSGQIWLTSRLEGAQVSLSVRDTGIGIAPDALDGIFEMFSQAKPALERAQGGLGIGLSLVRGLVQLHGGTIEARSEGAGRGSEFIVRLPTIPAPREPQPPQAPRTAEPATSRRCVLVAEDNRDAAESLVRLLRLEGHDAYAAHDGRQALQKAQFLRPDVALVDIGLPELNGYDVARHLRRESWGKQMVLVAVTGWGQDDDKRQAEEAGFDGHMVKPVDPAFLFQLLADLRDKRNS